MKNSKWHLKPLTAAFAFAGLVGFSLSQQAVASIDTGDETLEISGFVENATYVRNRRGLSKFRNTLQLEGTKLLGDLGAFSEVSMNGTFRATYDGVYDLNSDEFGNDAGRAITLEQVGPGTDVPGAPYEAAQLAHGDGLALFGSDVVGGSTNPNEGLVVLGEELHDTDGGVAFGVPVRPCDKDSRGCIGGYMDADLNELRHPEFNDRWDFIREFYISGVIDMDSGTTFNMSMGKKQEVWGRTDLFRVLDIINPVDYSRNNIYDELEDIRIPVWMATAEWQFGANEILDDANFQFVWVFDKFRPSNLGQSGTPNSILDAGSFFRGMNNCWENGCTVANFAGGSVATDFGPNQIGIRKAHTPEWSLANSQIGAKFEGVYQDIGFSLNAMHTRSQLPSLRGGIPATNSFTGVADTVWPYLIAFDIHFPRITMIGGSLDLYSDAIKTAFRVETAWTTGEEFANTLESRLFSESDVVRWVIGADHNFFIRGINKNKAFLMSFQTFGQHILEHEREEGPVGEIGMPDWKDNYISTLLLKGWWKQDRLSPQIISAYDWGANAFVIAPSIDWIINDHWRLTAGANIKLGDGARKFSDCRTCNPFPPATETPAHSVGSDGISLPGDVGLAGFEPLGRFRSGPIGMAQNEDEIQVSIRYRF